MNTTVLHNSISTLSGLPQTPYRVLNSLNTSHEPRTLVPAWAESRKVIRAGHATYYVVETSRLSDARDDLDALERAGWVVDVHPLSLDGAARITMNIAESLSAA